MENHLERVESFFAQYTLQKFAADQTFIEAGQEPAGIYYLKEGRVRQYTIAAGTGAIFTLHVYHPGSFFPLTWAMAGKPNRHYFDTLAPSVLCRAPQQAVVEFLKQEPEILYHLTTRLLAGLDGMLLRVETLALTDVYSRVISELVYLMKHYGEDKAEKGIKIGRFTHQEIAEFVGSARETVSIAMKKLEDANIIRHEGHTIYIPNPERLTNELGSHSGKL